MSALKGKLLSIDISSQEHLGSEMKFAELITAFSWFPLTACLFYPSDLWRMSGMRYHPVMSQTQYATCLKSAPDGFKYRAYCTSEVPDIAKQRHDCAMNCEKKSKRLQIIVKVKIKKSDFRGWFTK